MEKAKYGVESLPEEIKQFGSFQDAEEMLTQYCARLGKHVTRDKWDSHLRFMYFFPDGSLCVLNAGSYNESAPKWEYYKHIKEADSYAVNYLSRFTIINSPDDILKETNPYGYKFAVEENIPSWLMLSFPKLEQLKKAGYAIADTIIYRFKQSLAMNGNWRAKLTSNDVKSIGMVFHKGTSLYEILGMSRDIAKAMKDVDDITLWNSCRKLVKKGLLDVESIRFLKEANYVEKDINTIYRIVTKGTDGKTYFTIPSLVRYLRKVDMYEAIPTSEALMLIDDYIRCCHALSVKPRFDSDSLKREHDVMARNARTKIEEKRRITMTEKMKPACDELRKYNYKEDIFFVRGIESFDDLLDEATQQANCVACYADSIAKRSSKIFVMRENAHPEKSLITIELTPTNTLRQKYLSHNRPIHNKAQSEFIDRWLRHIRANAS